MSVAVNRGGPLESAAARATAMLTPMPGAR
jgi:hypothetical protein